MSGEQGSQSQASDLLHCPNCGGYLGFDANHASTYVGVVCQACDVRAITTGGSPASVVIILSDGAMFLDVPEAEKLKLPQMGFDEDGPNPVFIDSKKCWRRYRFGGWATMLDPYGCRSLGEFYARQHGQQLFPCPVCGEYILGWDGDYSAEEAQEYPGLVCRACDGRAVNSDGQPAIVPEGASGDNPVFIDSRKCWRLFAAEYDEEEWLVSRDHVTILASGYSRSLRELRRIRGHHSRRIALLHGK